MLKDDFAPQALEYAQSISAVKPAHRNGGEVPNSPLIVLQDLYLAYCNSEILEPGNYSANELRELICEYHANGTKGVYVMDQDEIIDELWRAYVDSLDDEDHTPAEFLSTLCE